MAQIMISYGQDWLGWPRAPLFSKGESLDTQDWSGLLPTTLAFSKLTLARGLKGVYFLDLFFNKKEKEQKVSLWRFCRNTGAGSFQEPEGWGV